MADKIKTRIEIFVIILGFEVFLILFLKIGWNVKACLIKLPSSFVEMEL